MDSLWKKNANGTYIDIFKKVDINPGFLTLHQMKIGTAAQRNKKNNETSTLLRQLANANFDENKWYNAMKYYNKSLCYAEIDTENVCFAYANRSLCYLKMRMYDKCLVDIEMAIKANYPQRLMSKLELRRAYCLKQLNESMPINDCAPKLDFEADDNFPGMANVIEMRYSEKYGRHFIAKCDIDIGKVVLVEKAFVTIITVLQQETNLCEACFKCLTNFIACSKCTNALFCSQDCAENVLHQARCGRSISSDNELVEYALRSIVQAINIFPNLGALIEFVESIVNDQNLKEVPQSTVDMKSKYRIFLKLNLWLTEVEQTNLTDFAYEMFQILMHTERKNPLFRQEHEKLFLKHLCVMHMFVVFSNSFQSVTGGIFLLKNHFNHSCASNLLATFYEDKSVCTTSRRIKKGDQLFISYGRENVNFAPRKERQRYLLRCFGFKCGCECCQSKNWPISSAIVKSDPEFKYLVKEMQNHKNTYDELAKCVSLKQKCLEILIKYADKPWCTELDKVSFWFEHLSVETMF